MNMHVTEMFKLHAELILVRSIERDSSHLLGINLHLRFGSSVKKELIFILVKQLIMIELLLEKTLYFYNYINI